MKASFTLMLVAVATLLLAGCAGGSASLAKREAGLNADSAYVARVEAIAKRRGVEVRWVNPPREIDRKVASR